MNLLKEHFPMVWKRLKEMEKNLDRKLIKLNTSGADIPNIRVKNRKKKFFHDKDDPLQEAENIIEQYPDVEEYTDILFYGTGLGYHINAFVKKYPGMIFSIYEPVPEIFFAFLAHVDLGEIPVSSIKYLFIEDKPAYAGTIAYEFVGQMRDSVSVIDFPAYKEQFPDKYDEFFTRFEETINERKSAVNTTFAFEKLWTLNSMMNLDKVISTPNILLARKDGLKNKPALLVGAGPSLDDEIENLRHIKENGLAYIFSAGAAINTLIDHHIHPHAACTYDPSGRNHIVFEKLINQGITDIPLIFGSSVGYETLRKYPGPKFHMLTSPDKVSPFYLKAKSGEKLGIISDAPSVASIVLQLLINLGFNPIILVGLNLAYKDNQQHATGLDYSNPSLTERQIKMALKVEDVDGNEVLTNPTYNRMKMQIEMYTDYYKDLTIINTTRGGAKINGTDFQPLDELIQSRLEQTVFEPHWLNLDAYNYDQKHLIKQYLTMNRAHEKMNQLIMTIYYFLYKIDRQSERRKFRNMEYMYAALNDALSRLKKNEFFNTFIIPMNQLADEVLQRGINNVNREKDNYKQAQKMVSEYEEYLYSCENDIQMISPIFQTMNQVIENFIQEQIKAQAKKIKVIIMNYDGVLTDGKVYCSGSTVRVTLNHRDKIAIERFKQQGIKPVIISRGKSKNIDNACRLLGIRDIFMDVTDKNLVLESICSEPGISYDEIACIIDDISDLELVGKLGLSFAVNDVLEKVKDKVDYLCVLKGGEGVLREVAEVLLSDSYPIHDTIIRSCSF